MTVQIILNIFFQLINLIITHQINRGILGAVIIYLISNFNFFQIKNSKIFFYTYIKRTKWCHLEIHF